MWNPVLFQKKNGHIVLTYNPRENYPRIYKGPRTPLSVTVSKDNAETFTHLIDLETEEGISCYPAIICNEKQELMMTYTWNRRTIVFCKFELEE